MCRLRYPIGIQNFEKLRRGGDVYVDKTAYIRQLIEDGSIFFLGRPRRFGKSLLLSTMHSFFSGERDLFKDLDIYNWKEWEWKRYPVIHIDLNAKDYTHSESLYNRINMQLEAYEKLYDANSSDNSLDGRFITLIQRAYEVTGLKVVVLIDEYDKPILDTMHDDSTADLHRDTLRAFYSSLKSSDRYLKFVFLTGITKFGQLNIFSGLNNLRDISLSQKYAGICGITDEELHRYFHIGVTRCAESWNCSISEAYESLKQNYDGYHFSADAPDVYNPWSVLNSLDQMDLREYWNTSGGNTSFLHKLIEANKLQITDLNGIECTADMLYGDSLNISNPVAILYQSGYLTIKSFKREKLQIYYTLGYPNKEVERGFINVMLEAYSHVGKERTSLDIRKFIRDVETGDCEAFLSRINAFFADFPYDNALEVEKHFQNVMYCIIKLMGLEVDIEYHTSNGRIDMLIKTRKFIYIIEFKRDSTPDEALRQISQRGYDTPFSKDPRTIIHAGVVFSTSLRRISDFKIISSC